jgi:hypothetical protein
MTQPWWRTPALLALAVVYGVGCAVAAVGRFVWGGVTAVARPKPRRPARPATRPQVRATRRPPVRATRHAQRKGRAARAIVRVARTVGESAAAARGGWMAGQVHAAARYETAAARAAARRDVRVAAAQAAARTATKVADPAPAQGKHAKEERTPTDTQPRATVHPIRKKDPRMTTETTATPTGEANSYEAAEASLAGLAKVADDTKASVETLAGSLASALEHDPESLGKIMAVEDAADALAAAVSAARDTFVARHEGMNEAVNAAPHAAPTEFYRG